MRQREGKHLMGQREGKHLVGQREEKLTEKEKKISWERERERGTV